MHAKEAGQSLGLLKLLGSIGMTRGSCHLGVHGVHGVRGGGGMVECIWALHGRCMGTARAARG